MVVPERTFEGAIIISIAPLVGSGGTTITPKRL